MNPCELTATVTAIANFIFNNVTSEQLELLSAIFNQLGDTLETLSTGQSICCNRTDNTQNSSAQ